jgi:hypothetical protein
VLDGTRSTGDAPIACTWSFENATGSIVWDTATGCRLTKTFESADTKYVRLIVRDSDGDTDSLVRAFTVKARSGRTLRASSSSTYSVEQTAGLVAAYGFDETSGTMTRDASPADNDGRVHGAARTKTAKGGRALSFDGRDSVSVERPGALVAESPLTLEAWIRPASGSGSAQPVVFDGVGGAVSALFAGSGSGLAFASATSGKVRARAAVAANRWSHIAATYDGRQVRVYVNGDLDTTAGATAQTAPGKASLSIGGSGKRGFRGMLDDVRIYSRALSEQEIRGDMLTRVGLPGPGD